MTQQQRRATRSALARYGQRGYRCVIMTRPTPSVPGCSGCATLSIGASRMSWSSST